MMLFPMDLFVVTNFTKNKLNFLLNCNQKLSNFSEKFPTSCVFRPNERKIKAVCEIFI